MFVDHKKYFSPILFKTLANMRNYSKVTFLFIKIEFVIGGAIQLSHECLNIITMNRYVIAFPRCSFAKAAFVEVATGFHKQKLLKLRCSGLLEITA